LHRVLMTGYLDVEAVDNDTLTVRRYTVHGLDVFGEPLAEDDLAITITRNLNNAAPLADSRFL